MGGMTVNDRAIGLLDQYEIEVLRTRKGRGAILCDSDKGTLIFKELQGPKEKIKIQNSLLKAIAENGDLPVEQIIESKEGELFVQDGDGVSYILKTYFEGKECNIHDINECSKGVKTLARLHRIMQLKNQEVTGLLPVFQLEKEYEKHNKELRRVRKFLKEKSQKNAFEIYLNNEFDYFLEQALEVTEEWNAFILPQDYSFLREQGIFCHGDYQYHNIIDKDGDYAIVNFEKCILDDQIRDLYLFMRKLLEKSNWSQGLGDGLLKAYTDEKPLSARSFIGLYYRLAYPEKFWKIVNFYYNSGKAWIPEKNMEKLEKLIGQEKEKQEFLNSIFRTV